jgi:hypothetical protein
VLIDYQFTWVLGRRNMISLSCSAANSSKRLKEVLHKIKGDVMPVRVYWAGDGCSLEGQDFG